VLNNTAVVLTVTQAAQLAAILPCLFLLIYLFYRARDWRRVLVPLLYFISMLCGFLLPVLSAFPEVNSELLRRVLIFNEHMAPSLSFLFILQLLLGRTPPWYYWLILLLPIVGGGSLLWLAWGYEEACLSDGTQCLVTEQVMLLYRMISSAVVFMLLLPILHRISKEQKQRKERDWRQQYPLIILLILYNLLMLFVDLAASGEWLDVDTIIFIRTMLGIGLLYFVPSLVFRAFSRSFDVHSSGSNLSNKDYQYIDRVEEILREEMPYRNLGFSRSVMADQIGVSEQLLSRLINQHYGKSFSEVMNDLRITDAQHWLLTTDAPITVISFDAGFSSLTSFNRVFKEQSGVAPSIYRQNKGIVPKRDNSKLKASHRLGNN